ncbi:hypothetical protein ACET9H_20900 [Aeromonas media]|uniref:hypothetical protein n=1 Tax=Aeromonas media TaxID=651 RepID=UPI0038D1CEA2
MKTLNAYTREFDGYDVPCLVKQTSTMKYPKTYPDCSRINAYNMKRLNCFMFDNRQIKDAHGDFVIMMQMSAGRKINVARKQYVNYELAFAGLSTLNIAARGAAERHEFDHEDHKKWLLDVKENMKQIVIKNSDIEQYANRTKKTVKPVFYTGFMKCDTEAAPWFASLLIMDKTNTAPRCIIYYFQDTWFGVTFKAEFGVATGQNRNQNKISSFSIDLHSNTVTHDADGKSSSVKWIKGEVVEDDFADDDFADFEIEETERTLTMQKYTKQERGGRGKKVDKAIEIMNAANEESESEEERRVRIEKETELFEQRMIA